MRSDHVPTVGQRRATLSCGAITSHFSGVNLAILRHSASLLLAESPARAGVVWRAPGTRIVSESHSAGPAGEGAAA